MARLNIERQQQLEPVRISHAIDSLIKAGYERSELSVSGDGKSITFQHKGAMITFWPYSGWASGKTIHDGRGLARLLKQLQK